MKKSAFRKIQFYYRSDVLRTKGFEKSLSAVISKHYPTLKILESNTIPRRRKDAPDLLIVLGGDGTILEATQRFQHWHPLVLGLNLGHVGFLASVRSSKHFTDSIRKVLSGNYRLVPHMLIRATIERKRKIIFSGYALNDIAVQNLLGMVDIGVYVEGHRVQKIHGTGVLVATATGSTAYNLSAHGPIVMPDIKCFIITELHDHSIPTPSLIIKRNRTITLIIDAFRKTNNFLIRKTGEPADVVLATDSERVIALEKGDKIVIKRSERLVRFIELEKNYFFKSLQEKFEFR